MAQKHSNVSESKLEENPPLLTTNAVTTDSPPPEASGCHTLSANILPVEEPHGKSC